MRNYEREYVQDMCRELIAIIGQFNRKYGTNDKKIIDVQYGKLNGRSYYGLDIRCKIKCRGISRIDIRPSEDDTSFEFDAWDDDRFTFAWSVDYRKGRQARAIVHQYVIGWLDRIARYINGERFDISYMGNEWHKDYFDAVHRLYDIKID